MDEECCNISEEYVITGYQIQLATDRKFTKNRKTVTVRGVKYYSTWSKVKRIKTR